MPRFSKLVVALAAATTLTQVSMAARAEPGADLQAQIDALKQQLATVERRQIGSAADGASPATAVRGGDLPGSFKLPGSDTSVKLGGYVKLDAVFSDRSAGVASSGDQEYEAGAVPVGPTAGANEREQVKLHARQSRLFVQTATPSRWGDVTTYLEADLFGAAGNESVSNSNGLRVRHAYGTIGRLLAGQTWTTAADVAVYPETVDFGGPAGVLFARQAQVRWTQPFAGGQWSVALENPETVASLPGGESFRADDDRFPDIAGNVKLTTAWGKFSLAGLARQLRVDSASAPSSRASKWGGAVGVNGVVPSIGDDDFRFSAYYGNAIGRYSTGFFTDAVLDGEGRLALPRQWMAMGAYRHHWRAGLRSTLALSALRSNNPEGTAGAVNRAATSAHLNLIWSPTTQTNLGIELIHATREVENGQSGRLNRLQAAAQYLF